MIEFTEREEGIAQVRNLVTMQTDEEVGDGVDTGF